MFHALAQNQSEQTAGRVDPQIVFRYSDSGFFLQDNLSSESAAFKYNAVTDDAVIEVIMIETTP